MIIIPGREAGFAASNLHSTAQVSNVTLNVTRTGRERNAGDSETAFFYCVADAKNGHRAFNTHPRGTQSFERRDQEATGNTPPSLLQVM